MSRKGRLIRLGSGAGGGGLSNEEKQEIIEEARYGIRYKVNTADDLNSISDADAGDLAVVGDERKVYQYDGSSWSYFFSLDEAHTHDDRYYTKSQTDNLVNSLPTLYSANGSLSGNREVSLNGKSLKFVGSNYPSIEVESTDGNGGGWYFSATDDDGNKLRASWYALKKNNNEGVGLYVDGRGDVLYYSAISDRLFLKKPIRVEKKLFDSTDNSGSENQVLTVNSDGKPKWKTIDVGSKGLNDIVHLTKDDIGVNDVSEADTSVLLNFIKNSNTPENYRNRFVHIANEPSLGDADGNKQYEQRVFYVRYEDSKYQIVELKREEGYVANHTHNISDVNGLQDALDNKSDTNHSHDDRYHTKTQVNNLLAQNSIDDRLFSLNAMLANKGAVNPNPQIFLDDDVLGYGAFDYRTIIQTNSNNGIDLLGNGTKGSLRINGHVTFTSDIFFPVAKGKYYRFVCGVAQYYSGDENPDDIQVKHYFGAACYDVDRLLIRASNFLFTDGANSVFTLASDLNEGDTFIHIQGDVSKWLPKENRSSSRRFMFYKNVDNGYRYIGFQGQKYDSYGYTRWGSKYNMWENADDIEDLGDGTFKVHLRSSWSYSGKWYNDDSEVPPIPDGKFLAGDGIAQGDSGSTYAYLTVNLVGNVNKNIFNSVIGSWKKYDDASEIGTLPPSFFPGTAMAKILILSNYAWYLNNNYQGYCDYSFTFKIAPIEIQFKNE
jgi:hypothetical protein